MGAKEKKEINIIVGSNIRFYRDKYGFTRERLSELIDVSPHFLYDVECGTVGVSLSTLKKICDVLGISADSLLWSNKKTDISSISKRLEHVDQKYIDIIDKLIQTQLEIIALSKKDEN